MSVPDGFKPENIRTRPGSKKVRAFYRPRCAVCQYMKKNQAFRAKVMQSTYFNPKGRDSLSRVLYDEGEPFSLSAVYQHMNRHQESDLMIARKRYSPQKPQVLPHPHDIDNPNSITPLANVALVEARVESQTEHELALNEFIRTGRQKMLNDKMQMTATNFLAAIKIKSDNEKNTKDRRLDMIKSFFTGAPSEK